MNKVLYIEYELGYENQEKVICAGLFRDLNHFDRFRMVEEHYGRFTGKVIEIKEIDKPEWYKL